MKARRMMALTAMVSLLTLSTPFGLTGSAAAVNKYDSTVLADHPVGYWSLAPGVTSDLSGHGLTGSFTGNPSSTKLPNGEPASAFNGVDQYFTVPDNDYLEVTRTGILTVEAWMRPDVLQFSKSESSGYVHWMGKGEPGQHSWTARMYNLTNQENRPNRISGYSFNLTGGLGAGSYFQDPVTAGEWIHYTLVINTVNTSSAYTTGYTKLYKNGVLRDQDRLSDYNIIPGNGTAPMRIGTRDLASFFEGAIGKVALYDYELTPSQLTSHYNAMMESVPAVPTGLTAVNNKNKIELAWTAARNAETYTIKRGTNSGGPYTVIKEGVKEPSFTDQGLPPGTYYYVVSSVSAESVESKNSNEAFSSPFKRHGELTVPASNVTASGDDGNVALNTVDGNLETRWSADGDGQWIKYDLGSSKPIDCVKIAWFRGDVRTTSFEIFVSADDANWTQVYSGTSSGTTQQLETYGVDGVTARFVKIVGHGNSVNAFNSITETEFWRN
ncbi:hypothetical protein J31TS4_19640 [Paenibacillus sp. J31TS4]|uniref:discoidin domain-containing protein n=1 Tax=Paenibacillus sp. J31TS4 TaxID=2807195 RepID=UPI001B1942EC|nr:discoidin domain-containing protein [Paenibacillus sp. J31TS4]GIP38684.1 hypothetical protein J31TS4_19640 [Paenibacillus sp. J31TS4]